MRCSQWCNIWDASALPKVLICEEFEQNPTKIRNKGFHSFLEILIKLPFLLLSH